MVYLLLYYSYGNSYGSCRMVRTLTNLFVCPNLRTVSQLNWFWKYNSKIRAPIILYTVLIIPLAISNCCLLYRFLESFSVVILPLPSFENFKCYFNFQKQTFLTIDFLHGMSISRWSSELENYTRDFWLNVRQSRT